MQFRYARHSPQILRPVISIELAHDGVVVPTMALIDSGADINLFSYEIGELLGLDVESGEVGDVVSMTGQPAELYTHTVTLIVGGKEHSVKASFTKALDDRPYGVLGQYGFFDLFKVDFDLTHEVIQVKPA
jgi:hypothetical protein